MDGDGKKPLKIAVLEFYKLNSKKGKEYTIKHFKKSVHRATVYRWLKKLNIWKGEFMPQIKVDYKAFWSTEINGMNYF